MRTRTSWPRGGGAGHGPAQGDGCPISAGLGWGGPARGASRSRKAAPYRTGNRAAIGHNGPDRERLAAERAREEALIDLLEEIAFTAESEVTRIAASVACLNRLDGPCRTMTEIAAEREEVPKANGIKVRFADE